MSPASKSALKFNRDYPPAWEWTVILRLFFDRNFRHIIRGARWSDGRTTSNLRDRWKIWSGWNIRDRLCSRLRIVPHSCERHWSWTRICWRPHWRNFRYSKFFAFNDHLLRILKVLFSLRHLVTKISSLYIKFKVFWNVDRIPNISLLDFLFNLTNKKNLENSIN